jgi:hypothetical protein
MREMGESRIHTGRQTQMGILLDITSCYLYKKLLIGNLGPVR